MTATWLIIIVPWFVVGAWIAGVLAINRKTHPRGLAALFFAELWERFSFYGMRALLVLYMVRQLSYADAQAYGVYGAYGALVYATPALGGLIADKLLGYRKAIILGAVLMALGHFAMAIEHEVFFFGALALLIAGNGFFKPNISSMVGKLYEENDPRRDGGFTLFYMGINAGALLAPLTCGTVGETFGWHYGFGLAGIGMLIGALVFWRGQDSFEGEGLPPDPERLAKPFAGPLSLQNTIVLGAFVAVPMFAMLVNQNQVMSYLLTAVGLLVFGGLFLTAFREEREPRNQLLVALILTLFSTVFWAFFEQAGSSMNLFTDRNVNRFITSDYELPTTVFQAVNPGFIIVLAPVFSAVWIALGKMNRDPSAPFKFALGFIQLGVGFSMMVIGAKLAGADAKVGLIWLVLGYLFHTTGELCLSPVGLSMITKLSPKKIVGLVMGAWFLSASFAHHIAGAIAKLTSVPSGADAAGAVPSPTETLGTYSGVFENIGYVAIGTGIVVMILTPVLKKMMHGVK